EVCSLTTRTWEREDGTTVMLIVYGTNVDDAAVIRLAETARPATDEEWQELLDRSGGRLGGSEEEVAPPRSESADPPEKADDVVEEATEGTWPAQDPGTDSPTSVEPSWPRGSGDTTEMVGGGGRDGLNWEGYVGDGRLWIEILGAGDEQVVQSTLMGEALPIAVTTAGDHRVIGGHVGPGRRVEVDVDGREPVVMGELKQPDGSRYWFAEV